MSLLLLQPLQVVLLLCLQLLLLLLRLTLIGPPGQLPQPRVGPLQQGFRGGPVGGVRGQAQRNDVDHPRAVALIGGGGGG